MKVWMIPILIALYWLPQLSMERDQWDGSQYDTHLFASDDERAMAVVAPDPFHEQDEERVRAWRAEVHVRVGEVSVSDELFFRTDNIKNDTLIFVDTAWGREVHVFERDPYCASGREQRRRWLAHAGGLKELEPGRTVF